MTSDPRIRTVPDPGLGNSSYLVDLGDGRALAVDACRDLRALQRAAEVAGLRVVFAADTHLHADFLSGAVQLASLEGAEVIASAAGGREFEHRGVEDGEEVDLGGLTLRALATPGHTGEHVAYLLLDGASPLGVFTGGSLLAGAAARTDLVDPDRTEEFARAQYRSLQRLAVMPDETAVWPTHGAGTFCAAGPREAGAGTTIGAERASNPMLNAPDEAAFVQRMLAALGTFPPYFRRLPEENRIGPPVLPTTLGLDAVAPDTEATVIDVRPVAAFAAGHPRGAFSIPLRPEFATWLGWLVPPDGPLLLLRDDDQDPDEVLWQAAKIGCTQFVGEIEGGMDGWIRAGLPWSSTPLRAAFRADDIRVLDIRQRSEFESGHVPGAAHIELGELEQRVPHLEDAPAVVMCGHGERAMSAASILERGGLEQVTVLRGGPEDWVAANPSEGEPGS